MGIGSVGIATSYYEYGAIGNTQSGNQAGAVFGVEEQTNHAPCDVLTYYQKLCKEFEGVTFRLDDVNEASKHATGSPYLGYNNSFNQVGEHFGDVGQCSISLDVSVIQRMQSEPKYEQAVKGMIENSKMRYSEFQANAFQDGYQYISVSIEDNNGQPQRAITQSNCPYSTEEEVRRMWNMEEYSKKVVSIADDLKNEAVDAFFRMYDESVAKRANSIASSSSDNRAWEKSLSCEKAEEYTEEDPVYEVSTVIDGKTYTEKIHVNDVMPTKATQQEMYAFYEHYDSVNGTKGSYEKFMAFMDTARKHGYWEGNDTYEQFANTSHNWRDILPHVWGDAYSMGMYQVYNEGAALSDVMEKAFITKIEFDPSKAIQKSIETHVDLRWPDIPDEMNQVLYYGFYTEENEARFGEGLDGANNLFYLEFGIRKRIAAQIDADGTRGTPRMWDSAISVLESMCDELDAYFGDELGNMDFVKDEIAGLKEMYQSVIDDLKAAKEEAMSESEDTSSEEDTNKTLLLQHIAEMYEKIRTGDIEQEFQIGAMSLTLEEWDKLIEDFDDLEEELKEAIKAEIEKLQESERISEISKTDESVSGDEFLTSEIRKTVFRNATDKKPELSYITCFTEDGIICKRTGMEEDEYLWKIDYEDEQDYEKVMSLLNSFPSDWDLRFAPNEKFWNDYLSERIDKEDFVSNLNQYSNNGKLNFLIEDGENVYINKEAAKYCNYMNNPEDRIYNLQEFTELIVNELRENQKKLYAPNDTEALRRIDEQLEDFKRHMLGAAYNKTFHVDYFSENYVWKANNDTEVFDIFSREGERVSTLKYADLMNTDDEVFASEWGFSDELLRTLSHILGRKIENPHDNETQTEVA